MYTEGSIRQLGNFTTTLLWSGIKLLKIDVDTELPSAGREAKDFLSSSFYKTNNNLNKIIVLLFTLCETCDDKENLFTSSAITHRSLVNLINVT